MEFSELVRRRRMIRDLSDEPVERAVLERIAAVAKRAPSAGNARGQRLLIVTEPELRLRVAACCAEEEYVAEGFPRWISGCAAQFVPCVSEEIYHARYREPDKLDEAGSEIAWPVPYWWLDIGATALLVHLAAIDEGLAAGFAGPFGDGPETIESVLGIPAEFVAVGVIPVGRPRDTRATGSARRGGITPEEFARWNGWAD